MLWHPAQLPGLARSIRLRYVGQRVRSFLRSARVPARADIPQAEASGGFGASNSTTRATTPARLALHVRIEAASTDGDTR